MDIKDTERLTGDQILSLIDDYDDGKNRPKPGTVLVSLDTGDRFTVAEADDEKNADAYWHAGFVLIEDQCYGGADGTRWAPIECFRSGDE